MINTRSKPFHFIEKDSPLIEEYRYAIEAAVASDNKILALSIAPEVVTLRDVSVPQEIVYALQHRPKHIEKMIGTLQFDFEVKEGSGEFLPDEQWKMKPKYLRWFSILRKPEFMPFFAKDPDVRLYMLAGDYLVNGKTPVGKEPLEEGRFKYILKGGPMLYISKRLFDCCRTFLFYCHGSGFDPKEHIQRMLAEFSLPVHYVDVYKQYQKDLNKYVAAYR